MGYWKWVVADNMEHSIVLLFGLGNILNLLLLLLIYSFLLILVSVLIVLYRYSDCVVLLNLDS